MVFLKTFKSRLTTWMNEAFWFQCSLNDDVGSNTTVEIVVVLMAERKCSAGIAAAPAMKEDQT